MTSYRDEAIRVLEECDQNIADAANAIYAGPAKIALYVIQLGLETLKSKQRRNRRRELRTEVKPQFRQGRSTGSVILTKASKERLLKRTKELFGENGWMIGDLNLGDLTKEGLLAQAVAERASAKGSLRNAQFYEALAEPLQPGQLAREYWKSETAHKIKRDIWKGTEDRNPDLR